MRFSQLQFHNASGQYNLISHEIMSEIILSANNKKSIFIHKDIKTHLFGLFPPRITNK